jgi:hypothetical protein
MDFCGSFSPEYSTLIIKVNRHGIVQLSAAEEPGQCPSNDAPPAAQGADSFLLGCAALKKHRTYGSIWQI